MHGETVKLYLPHVLKIKMFYIFTSVYFVLCFVHNVQITSLDGSNKFTFTYKTRCNHCEIQNKILNIT